jgi:hypothetical protein
VNESKHVERVRALQSEVVELRAENCRLASLLDSVRNLVGPRGPSSIAPAERLEAEVAPGEPVKRRRGRPPRVRLDAEAELRREAEELAAARRAMAAVGADDRLIPIEGPEMDAHPFGRLSSVFMRRRWIREGKLQCVRVGRRTYVSESAIAAFVAAGGSR